MKKILIFGFTNNPGGIENVIMNYYRNIDKQKIQFDFLINTEEIVFQQEIIDLGGKIHRICSRTQNYKQYKEDLKNFFKNNAKYYTAIWVNFCNLTNLDYLKYAKKYGIKCRIMHSHNSQNMSSKLHLIIHKINRIFLKYYATDYWACSDSAGKWFFNNKIMKSDKYKIINNAIDINKFKYDENTRKIQRKKFNLQDKFVIGNVGRLQYQKNQEFLIDVFQEITKHIDNAHLLLVGQGEDETKLKQKVERNGLSKQVTFLGAVDNVPQVMQTMDIFVFPSKFEGLGLVLVEAQANGIPIFASKEQIPKEIKMSNNFEFIELSKTPREWAEIIINLSYKEKQFKRENNSEFLRKNGYDIEYEANKLQNYFERI